MNLPAAPCACCGGIFFNGHESGEIHCAECESGEANDQPSVTTLNLVVVRSDGSLSDDEHTFPKGHDGREILLAHGYVRRWTLALGPGYIPGETSHLAHTYAEVVWDGSK